MVQRGHRKYPKRHRLPGPMPVVDIAHVELSLEELEDEVINWRGYVTKELPKGADTRIHHDESCTRRPRFPYRQ
jgi:hypothetical protein